MWAPRPPPRAPARPPARMHAPRRSGVTARGVESMWDSFLMGGGGGGDTCGTGGSERFYVSPRPSGGSLARGFLSSRQRQPAASQPKALGQAPPSLEG
ncbi:unnamed protein product [Lota lota]